MSNYIKGRISKLANIFFSKRTYPKNGTQFIVSLYAAMPDANEKIIQKIKTYPGIVDLNSLYTSDEISFLVENFEYIFKEYHSFLNESFFGVEASDLDKCISSLLKPFTEKTTTFIPYIGLNYILQRNTPGSYDIILTTHDDPLIDIAEEVLGIDPVTRIKSVPADYIDSSLESGKKYNNIIAIPLFCADPDNIDLLHYEDSLSNELINMTGMLENGGQMAVLIKETACHTRELRKFREYLVDNSNAYKTTVIRIPINNVPQKVCACLVLVEKVTASAYHRPICLGNLDHAAFKVAKGKNACILNTKEIVSAVKREDPQYFIKLNAEELKEGYDFLPTHYTINEEYRLTNLINSYLSKGIFNELRSEKSLIASLYSLIKGGDRNYIDILQPLISDLNIVFSPSNIQFLLNRFDWVVEYCYTHRNPTGEDEALTSDYLDLIQTLCFETNSRNVLLPFGNIRLARTSPYSRINAIECSTTDWAIAQIVKEGLGLDAKIFLSDKLKCEYSVYDHIIARPHSAKIDIHSTIDTIIECIDKRLSDGGTMAILLPREACYASKWVRLREYLIKDRNDIYVGVISLRVPSSSSINEECLCIVEKRSNSIYNTWDNRIVLVDADKEDFLLSNAEVGPYGLKVQSIKEAIEKRDNKSVIAVSPNNLDKGFNLLAARYLRLGALPSSKAVQGKVVHLRDVISIIPRIKQVWTDVQGAGDRIVTYKNLSDNYLVRIKPESVDILPRKEVSYTTANGGYVAFSNGKMLVGKIIGEPEDRHIGIDDIVAHFNVDSNVTSLDYILKVISEEDYVVRQAKYLTKGYTWTDEYLHAEDLLEIRIVLPSLEEQNKALLEDSQKGYEDKSEEVQRNFDEFRRNMHMQKHKIGQTIGALSTWVNLVNYARQLGNGTVDDSAIIVPEYNTSAKEIFEKLTRTAAKLQREIDVLDSSYGIENDIEDIALADFLDEYIDSNVWNGFDIIWYSQEHRHQKDIPMVDIDESEYPNIKARLVPDEFIVKAGEPKEYIRCTYQSLETILDNIIANARSHGFKRQDRRYQIKFDIEEDFDKVILYVSNNGEPMHKDMESDDVYAYGHSSDYDNHSGIGCYQIKDYMDTLKGNVEIISTPDEDFTVTYKLTFVNANPSQRIDL